MAAPPHRALDLSLSLSLSLPRPHLGVSPKRSLVKHTMAAARPKDNDPDKIAQMEFDKMDKQVCGNFSGLEKGSLALNADESTATKRVYNFEYGYLGWFFSLLYIALLTLAINDSFIRFQSPTTIINRSLS